LAWGLLEARERSAVCLDIRGNPAGCAVHAALPRLVAFRDRSFDPTMMQGCHDFPDNGKEAPKVKRLTSPGAGRGEDVARTASGAGRAG
jgi:hypothetical protein